MTLNNGPKNNFKMSACLITIDMIIEFQFSRFLDTAWSVRNSISTFLFFLANEFVSVTESSTTAIITQTIPITTESTTATSIFTLIEETSSETSSTTTTETSTQQPITSTESSTAGTG